MYDVRTLFGPWVSIVILGAYAANLTQRGAPWRGDPLWSVEWLAITLFVVGPLVSAVSAVDAARLARPDGAYLIAPTRRRRRVFIRALLFCVVPAIGIHLFAYLLTLTFGHALSSLGDVLLGAAVLVQALSILWFGLLGSLLGRVLPVALAGLVGGVAAFSAIYALGLGSGGAARFALLNLGGASVPQIGLRYNTVYLLLQTTLFVLALILFLAAPIKYREGRQSISPVAIPLGLFVVAVICASLFGPSDRKFVGPPIRPDNCHGVSPTICLYSEQSRVAASVDGSLRRIVVAAKSKGYAALAPERIEQRTSAYWPPRSVAWSLRVDPADVRKIAWVQEHAMPGLLLPDCEVLRSPEPPPARYLTDMRDLIATWSVVAGLPPVEDRGVVLSPAQVAQILDRWEECDL
jgi:hypothetical protein